MPGILKFVLLSLFGALLASLLPPAAPLIAQVLQPRLQAWWREAGADTALRPVLRVLVQRYSRPMVQVWIVVISVAILLLIAAIHSHVRTAPVDDFLVFGVKQVILTLSLGVCTILLFWIVFPVHRILNNLLAAALISVLISASTLLAKFLTIELFSAFFPFSLSYVPVSFNAATVMLAFSLTAFGFIVLAMVFELTLLLALFVGMEKTPRAAIVSLLASLVGFTGAWTSATAMQQAMQVRGRLLMLEVARTYDFTANHMCDARENESVVFIDHVGDRAIAATFPSTKNIASSMMGTDDFTYYLPYGFRAVPCNVVAEPSTAPGWCEGPARYGFCTVRHE